jgi:hypothetical protein
MMDRRVITGVTIIIIILLLLMGVVVADMVLTGKRVTISGRVSYNIASGWDISAESYNAVDDSLFHIAFFYMPWQTKDILVEATLVNTATGEQYNGLSWIGRANVVYSNKPYDVTISFMPEGSYTATLVLYEVDKGFWGVLEQSRVEQGRATIEVTV